LTHRYRTERIRQFHFQYILSHLGPVVAAMGDDAALISYRAARAEAIARFLETAKIGAERVHRLKSDMTEAQVWILPGWVSAPKTPSGNDEDLASLLDALRRLRIDVQDRYSGAKLATNAHAPGTRANLFVLAGDLGTAVVVLFAFLSGLAMAVPALSSLSVFFWTVVGVFSALGLMARVGPGSSGQRRSRAIRLVSRRRRRRRRALRRRGLARENLGAA
jgi:hypothetical protein